MSNEVFVTYNGVNGWDSEIKRANEIFKIGEKYPLDGGSRKRYSTTLRIKGVYGEWNSVMFDYDDSEVLPLLEDSYTIDYV